TAWALERLEGLLGGERVKVLPQPIMPSEDFSFVLRQVPGTYLMLGAGRTDVPADRQGDNHSPFVIFDDSVLADQAAVLAHLALERLNLADCPRRGRRITFAQRRLRRHQRRGGPSSPRLCLSGAASSSLRGSDGALRRRPAAPARTTSRRGVSVGGRSRQAT